MQTPENQRSPKLFSGYASGSDLAESLPALLSGSDQLLPIDFVLDMISSSSSS